MTMNLNRLTSVLSKTGAHLGDVVFWVRIFRDGRKLIDSARLVSEALSGSIASG